ncbi:hypothetical protein AMJ80_00645 [bacterium SM23_31]|nr:MAG: hypothetical protein AMJ80_00645 [bacterium SM23_31]
MLNKLDNFTKKTHLCNFTLEELISYINNIGEKPYRARQIFEWIHRHHVSNFSEMTNLPKVLQHRLAKIASVSCLSITEELYQDSVRKFLFMLSDGLYIETVFLPENSRKTICVSSQVGCALKCTFCATGLMGFSRNLTAGEIVDQLLTVSRITGEKMTNVVFMGMGEPFLNYENVIKAAGIINDKRGYGIGARHITISTVGLVDKIVRFLAEGHKFKLAVSINAGSEAVRRTLMPISKKFPLEDLKKVISTALRGNSRLMTLEYVLLKDVNDSDSEIEALTAFIKSLPVKINLIPLNSINAEYKPPSEHRIREIYQKIRSSGIQVNVRKSLGNNIKAACGQLFVKNNGKKI